METKCTPAQRWLCVIGSAAVLLLVIIAAGFWYMTYKDVSFKQRSLELQLKELELRTQELEISKKAQNIRVNSGVIDCAKVDQFDEETYKACQKFMLDNRVDE